MSVTFEWEREREAENQAKHGIDFETAQYAFFDPTVEFKSESETLTVGIIKADGHKCDRCWNYSLSVGTFPEDPTICDRCEAALKGEF